MTTIATHNGTQVSREHNLRNPKVVDKEAHIIKNGIHETWRDESVQDAYKRIFQKSVEKFNNKQKRDDRKIYDYLKKVQKDKQKHVIYEIIVGVYDKNLTIQEKKEILKEYVENWEKRNPNLELIGVYFHADEAGEPHVHIDYIPVARGCTRGLEVQNSLTKALNQQGIFGGKTPKESPQIEWERAENSALEAICVAHGLEVDHPQRGKKSKHMETEIYKLTQQKNQLVAEIEQTETIVSVLDEKVENLQQKYDELEESYTKKLEKSKKLDEINQKVDNLQQKYENLQQNCNKKLEELQKLDDELQEVQEVVESKEFIKKSYEFTEFKDFLRKNFSENIVNPVIQMVDYFLQEKEKALKKIEDTIIKKKNRQKSTDLDINEKFG